MNLSKILSFDGWDEGDVGQIQMYVVTFEQTFGKFSKGEEVKTLVVDFNEGEMQSFDDEGNVIKQQRFELTPVD